MDGIDLLMNTKKIKKKENKSVEVDKHPIVEMNLKLEIKKEITDLVKDILKLSKDTTENEMEELNSIIEKQIENVIELLKFKYQYVQHKSDT